MGYYINCIKSSDQLTMDLKELVPDMNIRRRMSRMIKMGVSTALECVCQFGENIAIDAIITGTGLGFTADSEKFLANIVESNEQMLNPTPFIQSTFNTIGAHIALIKRLHCYNNTFSHRHTSFESALLDAIIRLDNKESQAVLVGVFDEVTPTLETVMGRMGLTKTKNAGEGAIFFILTSTSTEHSIATIEEIILDNTSPNGTIMVSEHTEAIWSGAVAKLMFHFIANQREGWITNDLGGKIHSSIKIKCC